MNLFIVDLEGHEITEIEKEILQNPNVGAVILFTRNYKDVKQLKELIESIHSLRPDIFIAADHEGGLVQRFQRNGFRVLPAARVYGDVYDLNHETGIQFAEKYGEIMASQLLEIGVDVSLAPALDLHGDSNVIGKLDRAFHSDPQVVTELAGAFINGMIKAGMPAVGKHFPGHGSSKHDSHVAKPTNDTSLEELKKTDLLSFINLISQKLLAAVMPAHITFSSVDSENTAGFSKIWLQEILREQLNFQGLVMSDCLSMAGADIGNMTERSIKALDAGCDMLIVCNQKRELLLELVQKNSYVPSKESKARIEEFKSKMKRFEQQHQQSETIESYLPFMLNHNKDRSSETKNVPAQTGEKEDAPQNNGDDSIKTLTS